MSEAEKFQQSTNARKWAEAFIEHKHRNSWTAEDIDEGLMLGWFANAMMVRHDRVKSDTRKATLEELKKEIEMNFSFHYLGKSLAKFINDKLEGEETK